MGVFDNNIKVDASGNATISGNLTVSGTTTTISTTNTLIADRLIELANGASTGADSGIIIERGSTGNNAAFVWDESDDTFVIATTTATGASTGDLSLTDAALKAGSLDISGNVDVDGTLEADAITVNGVTLAETISDTVGAMVTSNTESGITVAYQDADNTLDFTVGTLNQDTTGTAAIATTVTVADESSDTSCNVLFTTAATGDLGPKSGTNLTFNSANGTLTATSLAGTLTTASQTNVTGVGTISTGVWQGTAIASAYLDADTAHLSGTQTFSGAKTFSAAAQFNNTVTVGADDQVYDVTLYGDTASAKVMWDTSGDDLIFFGAAACVIPEGQLVLGSTAVTSTAAELNLLDGVSGLVQADLTKLAAIDATEAEIDQLNGLPRGNLVYGNASAQTARLTPGSNNQVLTSDGTDISWQNASGGGANADDSNTIFHMQVFA